MTHLFSGLRRDGDCHFWAHQIFPEFIHIPNMKLCIMSLDTAVDATLCNLAEGESLKALFRVVDLCIVACALAGPPCETWSGHHSRTASALFGKLMLNNVLIELRVYFGGGATGMEHPAPPFDPDDASIWRTQLQFKFCMKAPSSQQIIFHQRRFGAPSVKPTTLRLLGLLPAPMPFMPKKSLVCRNYPVHQILILINKVLSLLIPPKNQQKILIS